MEVDAGWRASCHSWGRKNWSYLENRKEKLEMRVTVDEETCIGCGLCPETCPELFELKDDKAIVKIEEVPEDQVECCRQAADECPVEAIQVE